MKKKAVVAVCALALVLIFAIGGTVAWLTTKTDEIKNTFTYGDIDIELAETTAEYKMVPGNTIEKDPKVTVVKNSENCWLFVKVEKSVNFDAFMTYEVVDGDNGWKELENADGIYYREVNSSASDQEFYVIKDNSVTVKDEVTKEMLNDLDKENKQPTLTFTAYAAQKDDNITTATDAWEIMNPIGE